MNQNKKIMVLSGLVSLFLVLGFFAQVYAAETVTVREKLATLIIRLDGIKGEPSAVRLTAQSWHSAELLDNGTNKSACFIAKQG
jgi:hypothetical protein